MGWYYTNGATKATIVAELTSDAGSNHKTLKHSVRGNTLFSVREYQRDGQPVRYIAVYLLRGDRDAYGYKPMDESMGPCELNCPLSFLDLVTAPDNTYSKEWRERVRAFHASQGAKRSRLKALKVGDTVRLVPGCKPPSITITSVKPLRGTFEGRPYRVSPRFIPAE
jgi:hypothetical protein